MAAPRTKTNVEAAASVALIQAQARRKELLDHYRKEEKVPMYLSPMYRPHFGNVMRVEINGCPIFFKVDGSTQMVPKTFADEITARRKAIDNIIAKQGKMASIANNFENAPGELAII